MAVFKSLPIGSEASLGRSLILQALAETNTIQLRVKVNYVDNGPQRLRLTHVTGVPLERETNCDLLPGHSVEQYVSDERPLLVLVPVGDLLLVLGHLVQAELLM